jgi:carboxypeptidase D
LRGAAIGNGWMDARHQYPGYLDYAAKHGLLEVDSNVGCLTLTCKLVCRDGQLVPQAYKEIKTATEECTEQFNNVDSYEPINIPHCEAIIRNALAGKQTM